MVDTPALYPSKVRYRACIVATLSSHHNATFRDITHVYSCSYLLNIYLPRKECTTDRRKWVFFKLDLSSFCSLLFNVSISIVLKNNPVSHCVDFFAGNGAPRFANYLQDHMVLQRAPQRSVVWGFGDAGKLTTLTINNKVYTTISSSQPANEVGESIWSVTLDPVSDEGPFDIKVSQPLANGTLVTIVLHDVLFGDVWICSGQSNMQMTVSSIFNATLEIQNAGNYPKIRVFTASLLPSAVPIEELLGINLNWSVASSQSVGGPDWDYMSATCWLYGRMVHEALGGRPMGLIATSWGGTPVEFWMPPSALHECNDTA